MKENTIINRNYYIKVYGLGHNTLVGWPMLVEIVGMELATKIYNKAIKMKEDKLIVKLRRGLKIIIYAK